MRRFPDWFSDDAALLAYEAAEWSQIAWTEAAQSLLRVIGGSPVHCEARGVHRREETFGKFLPEAPQVLQDCGRACVALVDVHGAAVVAHEPLVREGTPFLPC